MVNTVVDTYRACVVIDLFHSRCFWLATHMLLLVTKNACRENSFYRVWCSACDETLDGRTEWV